MKIIVGLGNPGKAYAKNRHNAGFMVVDKLAHDNAFVWKEKSKLGCYIAEGEGFVLVKPTTYMNSSGRAVQAVKQLYKSDDILVVCDDIDREFGSIRVRLDGGHGGNNGLESIISAIGKDFARVRISAGNENRNAQNASDFVISDLSAQEAEHLPHVIEAAIDQVNNFISGDLAEDTIQVI